MSEIAAASVEQGSGIEQVNQAITQMDDVTQQNAVLVEQAAAAAESLEEQAANMAETVAQFKLSRHRNDGLQAQVPVNFQIKQLSISKPNTALKRASAGGESNWVAF